MTNCKEEWRRIPGFPHYEVSDQGRVRSFLRLEFGQPVTFSGRISATGYRVVGIRQRSGARRQFIPINRLMLMTFVRLPEPGEESCHWDGVKTNNVLSNLRWGSRQENSDDNVRLGVLIGHKAGVKHHGAKLWDDAIRTIRAEPYYVGVNRMLSEAFSVSVAQIRDIRARLYWNHVPDYG